MSLSRRGEDRSAPGEGRGEGACPPLFPLPPRDENDVPFYSEVLSPELIGQLPDQAEVSGACRHTERLNTHLWAGGHRGLYSGHAIRSR